VDPDNPVARGQVGKVATAVREFDRTAPGQRWLRRLRRHAHFRHWLHAWQAGGETTFWLGVVAILLLLVLCFFFGYYLGYQAGQRERLPELAAWHVPKDQPPGTA
jgi:hypothetical protein